MDLQDAVTTYGEAWNERDEGARRALLERAWTDDGFYCDPLGRAEGRDALIAHIGGFQEQYAGARIDTTSGADEHDGWFRFAWSLDAGDGTTMEGFDVGRRADDGRIELIVGFFGPFPPPPG